MLENTSCSESTLGWVLFEILTDRCEVLSAKSLFLLQLFLSVSESTTLFLHLVLTCKPLQPESAKLGLDLALPWVLLLHNFLGWGASGDFNYWCPFKWLAINQGLEWTLQLGAIVGNFFLVRIVVTSIWGVVSTSCLRSASIEGGGELQVKHWNGSQAVISNQLWRSRIGNESFSVIERKSVISLIAPSLAKIVLRLLFESQLLGQVVSEIIHLRWLRLTMVHLQLVLWHLLALEIGVSVYLLISKVSEIVWSSMSTCLFTQVYKDLVSAAAVHKWWLRHCKWSWCWCLWVCGSMVLHLWTSRWEEWLNCIDFIDIVRVWLKWRISCHIELGHLSEVIVSKLGCRLLIGHFLGWLSLEWLITRHKDLVILIHVKAYVNFRWVYYLLHFLYWSDRLILF